MNRNNYENGQNEFENIYSSTRGINNNDNFDDESASFFADAVNKINPNADAPARSYNTVGNGMFILTDDDEEDEVMQNNRVNSARSRRQAAAYKQYLKLRRISNIVLSLVLVISILFTTGFAAMSYMMGDARYNDLTENHEELGIATDNINKFDKEIVNIALFGVDSRKKNVTTGLSDAIMILTVNPKNNTIKIASILRDSYVSISGHGKQKITHAYSLGGPKLAIKTLNQNFDMNITDYVTVNLHQLWGVIDLLGGIDITITEKERQELNRLSNSEGLGVKKLDKAGEVHLDGGQAMIYARIRKIDSESIRALRQQKVLNCLFEKVKKMKVTQYPSILKKIMTNVETSLSYDEIISFAPILTSGSEISLQRTSIPGNDVPAIGGIYGNAGWVWRYDLDKAADYLHEWIVK